MKTTLKPIVIYCVLFISLISKAQRNESVILENRDNPKINFKGYIGNTGGKMFGKMVEDMPVDSIKNVCTYFQGDSLVGFDYEVTCEELKKDGFKFYLEFRNMMYQNNAIL